MITIINSNNITILYLDSTTRPTLIDNIPQSTIDNHHAINTNS